jgi:NADH-quinone oxidoreductase subunit L
MMDTGQLTLAALLLPAVSFLVLALVVPLRRSGRPAAYLSVLAAALSLGAAAMAWLIGSRETIQMAWEWLPAQGSPLATIGVVADRTSTVMLVLVALVAFLVQVYSLGYLDDEPPVALGRYYA